MADAIATINLAGGIDVCLYAWLSKAWKVCLGEQMMENVGADVVMDVVENAIISIKGGQSSPQITPLLQ